LNKHPREEEEEEDEEEKKGGLALREIFKLCKKDVQSFG